MGSGGAAGGMVVGVKQSGGRAAVQLGESRSYTARNTLQAAADLAMRQRGFGSGRAVGTAAERATAADSEWKPPGCRRRRC